MNKPLLVCASFLLMLSSGCASLSPGQSEAKRIELVQMADQTISTLKNKHPVIAKELNHAVAYGVANMKLTKVPVIGAGGGEGVLITKGIENHIFYNIERIDFGGGWGARAYKVLIIFSDPEVLEHWENGMWLFEAGAEASAGSNAAQGSSGSDRGFTTHVLAETGASATVTARVIHIDVNNELSE